MCKCLRKHDTSGVSSSLDLRERNWVNQSLSINQRFLSKRLENKVHHGMSGMVSCLYAGLSFPLLGGNMLNDISPLLGFAIFVIALFTLLGYWTWIVASRLSGWRPFSTIVGKLASVLIVVIITVYTSPYYIGYFIKNQGTIEMPTFVDDSTEVQVHYGTRPNDWFYSKTTVGRLKQQPNVPFSINGQDIFTLHIEQNRLYIDTLVFAGIENQDKHMFTSPVVIHNNAFSRKPDGWKVYQNNTNLEIQNQDGIPVLLMEYKSPYQITISGLFVSPMGIVKVNNETGIYMIGDTLSELGTYRVNRVFIHSVFDIFNRERIYNLQTGEEIK